MRASRGSGAAAVAGVVILQALVALSITPAQAQTSQPQTSQPQANQPQANQPQANQPQANQPPANHAGENPAQTPQTPITELYRSGLWSTYSGTDNNNRPFCSIATAGGEGRRVAVTQLSGETALDLQLSKDSWVIPDNTHVRLGIQFDGRPVSPAEAVGSGRTLSTRIPFEQSVSFMRALRYGRVLRIIFSDGNETPWTGGLAGSGAAITAFNTCRDHLAPPEPTQPFRANPPSGTAPPATNPTQPFAAPAGGK
jgi:hypothetical protein